jgi:hypothetical protein
MDGAFGEMPGAKIALHAATPRTYESEVQRSANHRARYGNQAADPFFRGLFTEFQSVSLGDARGKFFNHLFFGEVLAEINSGCGCSGEPKFAALIVTLGFKSVK